jgi:hypothetical protein
MRKGVRAVVGPASFAASRAMTCVYGVFVICRRSCVEVELLEVPSGRELDETRDDSVRRSGGWFADRLRALAPVARIGTGSAARFVMVPGSDESWRRRHSVTPPPGKARSVWAGESPGPPTSSQPASCPSSCPCWPSSSCGRLAPSVPTAYHRSRRQVGSL